MVRAIAGSASKPAWSRRLPPVAVLQALNANITTLTVDAIVNAANSTLLGGGGVDGAIHNAAGPALLNECKRLGGCPPGEARITHAYQLKAKRIIHTVGPIWGGGSKGEAEILASCYRHSLRLAVADGLRSIAFPSISTGAYGYPIELAAPIAVRTVREFIRETDGLEKVIFCCFSGGDYRFYSQLLRVPGA
jgi:O-acetyl-ADP-ribose deacetylase (regulator of RNase III)